MDNQLIKVHEAQQYAFAAMAALQQGLGRAMDEVQEGADPARIKLTLEEVFQASQDTMDQMGRASVLQHRACCFLVMRSAGWADTALESCLSKLPIVPGWLFGEGITSITDEIRLQKESAGHFGSVTKSPPK